MNLQKTLIEYGLGENEARVYLFLLKKIEATAFEISKQVEIPRTTVYSVLESLKKNGFISSFRKNNVLYFMPESLNRFNAMLEEKNKLIQSALPELQSLMGIAHFSPNVKLFSGRKAVGIMLDDVLNVLKNQKIKTLYAISQPEILEFFPKYFRSWLKKREDLGVKTHLILSELSKGKSSVLQENTLREIHYLPDKFLFDVTVNIYGKKVSFLSLKDGELYGVIIESESIANMIKQLFLFTWEMSE